MLMKLLKFLLKNKKLKSILYERFIILAGRMNAVNREFVYIDFDDERFPPCERGDVTLQSAGGCKFPASQI